MAQIHDGPSNLSHEHHQPPQISALDYAVAKLKNHPNGSPVLSAAAIALYLHLKDEPEVDFLTLTPYLRKYPLHNNSSSYSYTEESFYRVWEMVSDLRQNQEMDIDVFRELTDENMAWNKPDTDKVVTTKFLQTIINHDRSFVSESDHRNFDAAIEVFDNFRKKDDFAEVTELSSKIVESMFEDSLKRMRAMHYFGLLAYDARHKTQDQPVNTQALKEQIIREAEEAKMLEEAKFIRSSEQKRMAYKMCFISGTALCAATALIVVFKKYTTVQNTDKAIAPQQEWYDTKQIILRDTTTQKEQPKNWEYFTWPAQKAQALTPGQ